MASVIWIIIWTILEKVRFIAASYLASEIPFEIAYAHQVKLIFTILIVIH